MKNEANSGVSSNNSSPRRSPFKLMTGGHRGRLAQIPIYLGKDFRMFIFQTDWKVLPMSALIAALIALVVGQNMYVTMEGQFQCSLALTCVCIWNGFFNSIQSVCSDRLRRADSFTTTLFFLPPPWPGQVQGRCPHTGQGLGWELLPVP